MTDFLIHVAHEYRRHKDLAERAVAALDDAEFFHRPGAAVNPVALIVKHVAGNLRSRWADFLTADGDKPDRDRDAEFVLTEADTRASLLAAWEQAWVVTFDNLSALTPADLDWVVTIRGEPHGVMQAILRNLTHTTYHVGQILYVARMLRPDAEWQTIPPGGSREHKPAYLSPR
jgi:uncharacterized damage-inducible protein DinB